MIFYFTGKGKGVLFFPSHGRGAVVFYMNVLVCGLDGASRPFEILPTWTCDDLRVAVESEWGIAIRPRAYLAFEGEQVPADKVLIDLGITGGSEFEIRQDERALARQELRRYKRGSWNSLITTCTDDVFLSALIVSGDFRSKHRHLVCLLLKNKKYSLAQAAINKVDANGNFSLWQTRAAGSGDLGQYCLELCDLQALDIILNSNYNKDRIKSRNLDLFAIRKCTVPMIKRLDEAVPALRSSHSRYLTRLGLSFTNCLKEDMTSYIIESHVCPVDPNPAYMLSDSLLERCRSEGGSPTGLVEVLFRCRESFLCRELLSTPVIGDNDHCRLLGNCRVETVPVAKVKKVLKRHFRNGNYQTIEGIMSRRNDLCTDKVFAMECLVELSQRIEFECGRSASDHRRLCGTNQCAKKIGDPEVFLRAFAGPLIQGQELTGRDVDHFCITSQIDHPLVHSSRYGNLPMLKLLLETLPTPVQINMPTFQKRTALVAACALGDFHIIKYLMSKGAICTDAVMSSARRSEIESEIVTLIQEYQETGKNSTHSCK
eukprot:TRINITY_DN16602_c0_g1_i1.p1 TRINITY_DN16602_c0_g1~~TRINITY_DN16602_c0_g1_i1.p1  ORF type:complete len:544 (+),score=60.61 TRINITY_DN16602_c0_g1_i1:8-1639(+)